MKLIPSLLALALTATLRADDWPQWLGPQRDGVWRETGIIERFPEGGPAVRWRVPIGGGYSGPAVAEGRAAVGRPPRLAGRPPRGAGPRRLR